MFNEAQAKTFISSEIRKAVAIQKKEYERWDSAPGFDLGLMRDDPAKLFWWLEKQRSYINPAYNAALSYRGENPTMNHHQIRRAMMIYSGRINEVLGYFAQTAEVTKDDPTKTVLNKKLTTDLITEDAKYRRKHHPTAMRIIEGKIIGRYSPDSVTVSDHRVVGINELTICTDPDYQHQKVNNLSIANKHHPVLFPKPLSVDLGIPKDMHIDRANKQINIVDLPYKYDDLLELMNRIYSHFRPRHDMPTLAEAMPELRSHRMLRGSAKQNIIPQLRRAYTPA